MSYHEDAVLKRIKNTQNKPQSVLVRALQVLTADAYIDKHGHYFLRIRGEYKQVNLISLMRAANEKLKQLGAEQITDNPSWNV